MLFVFARHLPLHPHRMTSWSMNTKQHSHRATVQLIELTIETMHHLFPLLSTEHCVVSSLLRNGSRVTEFHVNRSSWVQSAVLGVCWTQLEFVSRQFNNLKYLTRSLRAINWQRKLLAEQMREDYCVSKSNLLWGSLRAIWGWIDADGILYGTEFFISTNPTKKCPSYVVSENSLIITFICFSHLSQLESVWSWESVRWDWDW